MNSGCQANTQSIAISSQIFISGSLVISLPMQVSTPNSAECINSSASTFPCVAALVASRVKLTPYFCQRLLQLGDVGWRKSCRCRAYGYERSGQRCCARCKRCSEALRKRTYIWLLLRLIAPCLLYGLREKGLGPQVRSLTMKTAPWGVWQEPLGRCCAWRRSTLPYAVRYRKHCLLIDFQARRFEGRQMTRSMG